MKLDLLFIGSKFIYNKPLQEYIIREIEKKVDFISSITFFKEKDNSLFLYLEHKLNSANKIIIVTTKQTFTTVGKLICTVTSDNQILRGSVLIPQKSHQYKEGNYLLEYKDSLINVLHIDEMQKMPNIFIDDKEVALSVQIFYEGEDNINSLLAPVAKTYEINIELITIIDGWFLLNLSSKKYGNISKFLNAIKEPLDSKTIVSSNIIEHIIERLTGVDKKISFAESCTGGLLSYYFTKQNGASQILDGSLVTYSNELKENWLGIDADILNRYGAVSSEVVKEMSEGTLNVTHADFSLSISGIAGDGGGTDKKPVGTVFIGVRTKQEHKEVRFLFKGDRNYIQQQSALEAIKMLVLSDEKLFF
ncbi:MAG: CinA family protein [Campylobacterota bacterium]|nr:CinA family protein [Campylobacterota bacterium]